MNKRKRNIRLFTFTLLSALFMNDVSGKSFLAASASGFMMTLQARTKRNMNIEDILCSKITMKILKALRKFERLNTSEITRKAGSNFADTASRLGLLEENEILAHSNFGVRSRIYRFNETPRAKAIQKLLEAWEREPEECTKRENPK
jgi:hypothetical protein